MAGTLEVITDNLTIVKMHELLNVLGIEKPVEVSPGTSRAVSIDRGLFRRGSYEGFEFRTEQIENDGKLELISVNIPVDKIGAPIPDRHTDAGKGNREIIVFDRNRDPGWIEYADFSRAVGAELKSGAISEEEALDRIFRFVERGLLNSRERKDSAAYKWQGKKVYVSTVLREHKGVCRHVSLAVKGMLDEAEMTGSFQQKGRVYGRQPNEDVDHAWVEYRMQDGRWALIDVSNQNRIIYSSDPEIETIRNTYKTRNITTPVIKLRGNGLETKHVLVKPVICSDHVRVRTHVTNQSAQRFSLSGKVGLLPPTNPVEAVIKPKATGPINYRLSRVTRR